MTEKHNIWWVYSTFPNKEEALSVCGKLLEERLIACANLLPEMTAVYRWQGQVQQGTETAVLMKTTQLQTASVIARVKNLHSYELPCIMALPLPEGFAPFMQWVAEETT